MMTMNTAWLRLLTSFSLVAPVARAAAPLSISVYTCEKETAASDAERHRSAWTGYSIRAGPRITHRAALCRSVLCYG